MKNSKWIFALAAVMFLPLSGFSQKGYKIQVKVEGLQDSLCYLANHFGDKQYLRDSANADAFGNIIFKGDTELKGGIYMVVLPGKKYFELIIDKEQHFSVVTKGEDYVGNMKVTGSGDNEMFYNYMNFIRQKSKEIEPLRAEFDKVKDDKAKVDEVRAKMSVIDSTVLGYRTRLMTEQPDFLLSKVLKASDEIKLPEAPLNPDGTKDSLYLYLYYKAHFFDNIDMQDDRLLYTPVFHPKMETYFTKIILQMPDSIIKEADRVIALLKPGTEMFKYVVWWLTNHYETSKIMGMDAVFVHMAEKYYTKELAFWADDTQLYKIQDRARVLKPILIGKKAKNLVMEDVNGTVRSMYDIKTKFTILYFWDPDCGHCKKVTPQLKELYDSVRVKGVQVFAVCSEVEIDKWKAYIKENNLNWINVADAQLRNNFRHDFDITSTPQIFLLDENKNIIAKRIEVETLTDILKKEFEKAGIK
jgi:thiol-disulfide isomerase/thioredoxin